MTEISPWVTYSWWYLCQVSLFMVYNISVYGLWASMTYRCCSHWWWCLKFQKLGSVTLPPPETRSSDYTYVCPLNVAFECFNFSSLWIIFQCRSRLYGRTDQLLTQFFSLAVLDPRVGHTMGILSPFISVLCHSDWLFHGESCPRFDVVHPGRAWPSSPACTWHCSLHYLFLQATPLFPHDVTIVC